MKIRKEKIEITDLRLKFHCIKKHEAWKIPVIKFDLIVEIENQSTRPVGFTYAIIIEHQMTYPEKDKRVYSKEFLTGLPKGRVGFLGKYQFAPICIETDFKTFISFYEEFNYTIQGIADINDDVIIKVKVGSTDIEGDMKEITLRELLKRWVKEHKDTRIEELEMGRIVWEDIKEPEIRKLTKEDIDELNKAIASWK